MPNVFHYNVVPSGANVSTRIAFQGDVAQSDLVAAAATSSGLTPEQVTAAGTAIFQQIIGAGKNSKKVRRLFNLFTFTPRCGGVHSDADFQPTPTNMNLSINLTLAPDGLALMEEDLSFQRDQVMGTKVPVIDRVYDANSRVLNKCTAGGAFRISGHDFGLEPGAGASSLGVFLTPVAGGAAVRVAGYSEWTETEIMGSWPSPLTGAQQLSIVTNYSIGGSNRTGMFGTHLTP